MIFKNLKNSIKRNLGWGGILFVHCITFLFIALPSVLAQDLNFKQWLSISDGLAHDGVTSVFEDSKGYLWVGTYDGLNRYDGYSFKVFKNTVGQKIFISNRIRTISEDDQGKLWIGTDEGISIYNPDQQDFQNIYSNQLTHQKLSGPIVRKILFNKNDKVAICATESFGIIVLGNDYSFHDQFLPPNENPDHPILFFDGIELDDTNYLFATSAGLFLFDFEKKQFTHIVKDQIKFSNTIIKTGKYELVVARSNGYALLNYEKKDDKYSFQWKQNYLTEYQLRCARLDPLGNLWLGTFMDGVVVLNDFAKNKTNSIQKRKYFKTKTGDLRTSDIYFSPRSGAWLGTFNKGLFQFELEENPFKSYSAELNAPYGLSSNRILSISALDSNRVYLNAIRGGLALFHTVKQEFEPLSFVIPDSSMNRVSKVFVDFNKNVWITFSNNYGFGRVRKGSNTLERITHPSLPSLKDLTVRFLTGDHEGNIWIGAVEGAYKINVNETGDVENIISINDHPYFAASRLVNVRYIYLDEAYDLIWIGSQTEGLFRINLENGKPMGDAIIHQFVHHEKDPSSLSSNFVTCIKRTPQGNLWLGTERGGFCKVLDSANEAKFITYSEKQGLSNNVVKAIVYDEGQLWIPTNIGLNRFDLTDNSFRRFRQKDRLPFEDFEYHSTILENGMIVLSGEDGLCYFDPENLIKEEPLPQIRFGDLKLFGKIILPNDTVEGRTLLQHSLDNTEEISLFYDENVFSVQLNSLHYSNTENYFLRHQLLPINDQWIEIPSHQQEISYNGLPPGEYKLRVMASNSRKEWTAHRELGIIIKPPFWKTNWAYLLYFLLLAAIIYSILYVVLRIQSLNHNLAIEKIEKDNIQERIASKLRFFANISHEIKTPIALISGPVDLLIERLKGNSEVNDKLQLIKRQSNKINNLVEQVHDFQKADANALKMKNTHFSFNDFVESLIPDFMVMANLENKQLEVTGGAKDIYVYADKDKLEKIFNNLLSNAFKYSHAGDKIIFDYLEEEKNVIVAIKDSGRGISKDDLPHIFERFYQSDDSNSNVGGAGIGLAFSKKLVDMHFGFITAESELGKGSTFVVRLPIVKNQLSSKELKTELEFLLEEEKRSSVELLDRKVDHVQFSLNDDFSGNKIFIAEDNTELRGFVSEVLSKYFIVTSFPDGKKCLEAMESDWPNLLISDIMMPELNGLELCRHIKSDIKTSHIPVILLTACTTIEDQIEGLEVGADAYVNKPFDIEHLVKSIAALLTSRKKLRERFKIDHPIVLEKNHQNRNDVVFLTKLYELMDANLDNQDMELDSFSKKLFLNRTHFYQKVKALTNHTPYDLMKEFRLKKAAELLIQQNLSVSQVYSMTGFKSRTHFSKLFREKYKVSPGKYGKL